MNAEVYAMQTELLKAPKAQKRVMKKALAAVEEAYDEAVAEFHISEAREM